eukprot:CAMPEP_0204275966 /NCGR_PEP_ID=MMETSP0468-20130131/27039_1 /ASSEMBLY_ACC=CAM_ASM_000383 /TAXON_ID=2969 /ORGANISM="Oxyrrhis marina" /LENGTH=352 /DNA_ID=CAMNT_0051252439 /DNA_START=47 /DNA_END=1105 /DNA_ORIENTATION=-
MLPATQKRFILAKRPDGTPKEGEHLIWEAAAPMPQAKEGQVVVRNLYMSLDPALRPQMSIRTYVEPVPVGDVMRAQTLGEVVVGTGALQPGALVTGIGGWQEYFVADPKELTPVTLPPNTPPNAILGILGITGLTAYFGLLRIGTPKAGETVLVSGAAGATGSVVAQIAKHVVGCRVIGIAGGQAKCDFLTKDLGLDGAIDYKAEKDLGAAIRKHCPKGVDVYFDNIGGDQLNAALRRMRNHGRVVMCGAISGYDKLGSAEDTGPGIPSQVAANMVSGRLRLQGFIVTDFAKEFNQGIGELAKWMQEGKIKNAETVVDGLENAAKAFRGLFEGQNTGKLTVKVADRAVRSKM